MTKYNETQARAIKKYLSNKADLRIWTTPEVKEQIKQAAERAGQSTNAYVLDAVNERIKTDQDGQEIPPELISRLIRWLKDNGHSDTDVVQFLKYISTKEET